MNNQAPLPALSWSDVLWNACRVHVLDQGPLGTTGHTGSDGSSFSDRIARFGTVVGASGENLGYGDFSPIEQVLSLLIDDGVPSRGHRTNLFSPNFTQIGNYIGPHKRYVLEICQAFAF